MKQDAVMEAKTALVLSGGGSLGAVQVGMLQALSQVGLPIDMVIGSSVGALNGAFFAAEPTPAGVERLAGLWRGLQQRELFPFTVLSGLKALWLQHDHLVDVEPLRALVRSALAVHRIEDTTLPLSIVATDALSGAEVVLSSGDLEPALLASTAVPVVFPQVELGGRYLVDGSISSSTPIATAVRLGARRIVVLPTGTTCAARQPPRGMVALALHMLSLLSMRQLDRDVRIYDAQASITIVPPLCPLAVSVFDFSQTAALIERAAEQATAWLADGGLDRTGPLHVPLAHHHHAHARHGAAAP